MAARIEFRDIERMLRKCAPGHDLRATDHKRRITYNGVVAHLPSKENEIYRQKVEKLVRDLNIDRDCVRKHLGISVDVPPAG